MSLLTGNKHALSKAAEFSFWLNVVPYDVLNIEQNWYGVMLGAV